MTVRNQKESDTVVIEVRKGDNSVPEEREVCRTRK